MTSDSKMIYCLYFKKTSSEISFLNPLSVYPLFGLSSFPLIFSHLVGFTKYTISPYIYIYIYIYMCVCVCVCAHNFFLWNNKLSLHHFLRSFSSCKSCYLTSVEVTVLTNNNNNNTYRLGSSSLASSWQTKNKTGHNPICTCNHTGQPSIYLRWYSHACTSDQLLLRKWTQPCAHNGMPWWP